jgi:hypothetical protein
VPPAIEVGRAGVRADTATDSVSRASAVTTNAITAAFLRRIRFLRSSESAPMPVRHVVRHNIGVPAALLRKLSPVLWNRRAVSVERHDTVAPGAGVMRSAIG